MEKEILGSAGSISIRRVTLEDQQEFTELARLSIELHQRWIVIPKTPRDFEAYVEGFQEGTAEGLVVFRGDTRAMVGFVNINGIVRSSYQRGILGYGIFAPSAGNRYMSDGLRLAISFAFTELGLNRLEADIQPENEASISLVKRIGFRLEGYSPGFISIGGVWRDHERWAITREMFYPARLGGQGVG